MNYVKSTHLPGPLLLTMLALKYMYYNVNCLKEYQMSCCTYGGLILKDCKAEIKFQMNVPFIAEKRKSTSNDC